MMKRKNSQNRFLKIARYSALYSIVVFIIFGIVTVLIPNKFFARMTPIGWLDYLFLAITSLLLGIYLSLHRYQKKESKLCRTTAIGGGISGFLGFGCPVCNKILVLLFGFAGVLTYIEPYRPIFGIAGIGLLGYATYKKGSLALNY